MNFWDVLTIFLQVYVPVSLMLVLVLIIAPWLPWGYLGRLLRLFSSFSLRSRVRSRRKTRRATGALVASAGQEQPEAFDPLAAAFLESQLRLSEPASSLAGPLPPMPVTTDVFTQDAPGPQLVGASSPTTSGGSSKPAPQWQREWEGLSQQAFDDVLAALGKGLETYGPLPEQPEEAHVAFLIFVNGQTHWWRRTSISPWQVYHLAYPKRAFADYIFARPTIMYRLGPLGTSGSLLPGETVRVVAGMIFNVRTTSSA